MTILHPFDKPAGWQEADVKIWREAPARPPPCNSVPIAPPDPRLIRVVGPDMREEIVRHAA